MKKKKEQSAGNTARVLSVEEYLSQIDFREDDFEFQHKDGFEHIDTNFASQGYWKEGLITAPS
ncbi:MAG: hypothetical protein HFG97_09985, partial [Dorea sp.]|nr:hypothetical protein [Dorea sp.]